MKFNLLILAFGVLLTACRHREPELPAFPRKTLPPGEQVSERVIPGGLRYEVVVAPAGQPFVVVEEPLHLPDGHTGSIYRDGKAVGRIRLSGPRKARRATADITAGEARVGDEWEPDP